MSEKGKPVTSPYPHPGDFQAAFEYAYNRLTNNESCCNWFHANKEGIDKFQDAHYNYTDLGHAVMLENGLIKVTGAATLVGTVYLNTWGPFTNQNMVVATSNGPKSVFFDFTPPLGLTGTPFRALLLLHELGHRIGIYGDDTGPINGPLNRQYTQDTFDHCFGSSQ